MGTQSEQHRNDIGTTSEQIRNKLEQWNETEQNRNNIGTKSGQHRNNIRTTVEQSRNKIGTTVEQNSEQHRNDVGPNRKMERHRNNIGTQSLNKNKKATRRRVPVDPSRPHRSRDAPSAAGDRPRGQIVTRGRVPQVRIRVASVRLQQQGGDSDSRGGTAASTSG